MQPGGETKIQIINLSNSQFEISKVYNIWLERYGFEYFTLLEKTLPYTEI